MRTIVAGFLSLSLLAIVPAAAQQSAPNTLTAAEQKEGFELLFDGKTLDKFIVPENQTKVWRVVNGVIRNEQAAPGATILNRSDADIRDLRSKVNSMRKASRMDPDQFSHHYRGFHEVIGRATGNPLMELLGDALRELETSLRPARRLPYNRPSLFSRLSRRHDLMAEAIEKKNAARAEHLMTDDFDEARKVLRRYGSRKAESRAERVPLRYQR